MSYEWLGRVAVVDLEAACALFGYDMLPAPLGRSRPVGSVWLLTRDVAPIEDRLHDGDLRGVRAWVESVVRADVHVECTVHRFEDDGPDLRVHGLRAGESCFIGVQTRDADGVDVVDIHGVSAGALAAAVVDAVGLTGAGVRQRIAVPGSGDRLPDTPELLDEYDDFGFLIPGAEVAAVPVVESGDVTATGTVRARCDPARYWGADADRRVLQWVQVDGDGDYLYEPGDSGYAEPVDAETLTSYLDGLIADELDVVQRYSATQP
ncbi:hypothetical protein SAMN04489835_1900 [Mycolicibacterium rutilum]|uniref:EspG family protein n=1 Tax=Mycolicibacterium rutilum TaxID=370526 RepID=A0A1H6JDC6_MYCRU|nr:ESX secretion-associated protein EspG [Mycolicibacterium rutilum]SEH60202.1 hypothetical protein SAMN04489835_1900 [Mycolicibacterium rutilum]